MTYWIIVYEHRHGVDSFLLFQEDRPDLEKVSEGLDDWEPEYGESLDAVGPFQMPVTDNSIHNADWPVSDWKYDVANGDTRLGYGDWVKHNQSIITGE